MKTNYPLLPCLVLLCIFFLSACAPLEDDISPTAPHTNTLSCYVDNIRWIPQRPDIRSPIQVQYYDDVKALVLSAERELSDQSINQYFTFSSYNIVEGSNNAIRHQTTTFLDFKRSGNCVGYDLDTTSRNNYVHIESIDKINKTIKGRFHFKVYDRDCDEELTISDGEFDLAY